MSDPTPAPLTDEQIDDLRLEVLITRSPEIRERRLTMLLAAVIAKARREAAEEIAREIEREAATLDHLPTARSSDVLAYREGLRHGMAGSVEHDLIGAAGIARQIGANHA